MPTSTSTSRSDYYVATTDGQGGDLVALSVDRDAVPTQPDGRVGWQWTVRINGRTVALGDDLQTAAGVADPAEAIRSLHSFLGAWVESVEYAERTGNTGENVDLFPAHLYQRIADWDAVLFELGLAIGVDQ